MLSPSARPKYKTHGKLEHHQEKNMLRLVHILNGLSQLRLIVEYILDFRCLEAVHKLRYL